ncbi:MAG: site-specific DNA-methyltransferase [Candidatus Paceibacterota bacterium]|jgi:DNA modification methylase
MSSEKSLPLQKVEQAKGRPLLQWVGKHPLESVQFYPAQEKEVYGDKSAEDFNKLFWGDNLQVLSHLLKEYRGEVDLIYIDPPFDSAADYVKKINIRGEKIAGIQQGLIEEKQYTDIWERDEYLQFIYERLLLMKELLSDTGSIYLHCDSHKNAYLRVILDEVFGEGNFRNEIIWHYHDKFATGGKAFDRNHDTIFHYSKTPRFIGNEIRVEKEETTRRALRKKVDGKTINVLDEEGNKIYGEFSDKRIDDVWDIGRTISKNEYVDYPTQKKEELLERIIRYGSNDGDLIADFFVGSGTACAAAQKMARRWIGCDINIGAIQTSTKRLAQIVEGQRKDTSQLLGDFKGSLGFKVLNVNEYDVFKNEIEAKEVVMEMYGVEPLKRSYFDGILDGNYVKVLPLNRVLGKMDIRSLLKGVNDEMDNFTKKTVSKHGEAVYKEGVVVICSGMELDARDFLNKENRTGVEVKVYDILTDTKDLIFKQHPESKVKVAIKGMKLSVEIQEFYSPLLMRKLELENGKVLKKEREAKVRDFKQIVDSVAIDVDYDGKLFNAEIMDLPEKKDVIKAKYEWEYQKKGKYTVAIKIIDVLGEEFFETFEVNAK